MTQCATQVTPAVFYNRRSARQGLPSLRSILRAIEQSRPGSEGHGGRGEVLGVDWQVEMHEVK